MLAACHPQCCFFILHFILHSTFFRGSANGRLPGFEPGDEGSTPSPRSCCGEVVRSGCWSNRTTPAPHAGNEGASPSRSTHDSGGRKAVIRQPWKLETVGSIPTPLTRRAHGPTGRHQFGRLEIRVRFPVGPLTEGSRIPVGRAALLRRFSTPEMRVRLPCLPLAPMVKRRIIPCF